MKSLGYLCGLVSEKGPNSEDLNRTVDLLAGLGAERPETGINISAYETDWCFSSNNWYLESVVVHLFGYVLVTYFYSV